LQPCYRSAERRIFTSYAERFVAHGAEIPALLPQVYLLFFDRLAERYSP
jgi:hypothetical protein